MITIAKGFVAGFVATVVLSAFMLVKAGMGVMPELNVIEMLTMLMGQTSLLAGWIAHFFIGTILWGGFFAWLDPYLPGEPHWLRGISFAIGAWVLMMAFIMPQAGAGYFGMNLGILAPLTTLVLHGIYGAVLGGTFAALKSEAKADAGATAP